jgi:Zn-dependent peptidase ImmA (M78 family)/ribosome-binding protein aMBF1 (putative translation factor)
MTKKRKSPRRDRLDSQAKIERKSGGSANGVTNSYIYGTNRMADTVRIAHDVLRYLREERRHLSISSAAKKLGIETEELAAFESGTREPSIAFVELMSRKYGINEAWFYLDSPIKVRKHKSHRTLLGRPPTVTFETAIALELIDERQRNLQEITSPEELARAYRMFPSATQHDDIEVLARRERSRLNVSVVEQIEWKNLTDAFRTWRERIEMKGVSVYLEKMNLDDCRGVSVFDEGELPAIIVNSNENGFPPKIFTLLHEYGHLLLRDPGLSDEQRDNKVESFCNQFAAAVLMPIDALKQIFQPMPMRWMVETVNKGAATLKVSRWSFAIRLETLGLVEKGFSDRFRPDEKALRTSSNQPAMQYVVRRFRELGSHYSNRVLNAVHRNAIDRMTAARMLNARPEYFPQIQSEMNYSRRFYGASTTAHSP